MMDSYLNKDVARILGWKPATVSFYTNKGFVEPEVENMKGKGTKRLYSKRNLIQLQLIKVLAEHGFTLEKIKTVLAQCEQWSKEFLVKYAAINKEEAERGKDWFNPWHVDDVISRLREIFLLIYDDDGDAMQIEFISCPRKSDLQTLKNEQEVLDFIKKFLSLPVDMWKHDSAFVINLTNLWEKVANLD